MDTINVEWVNELGTSRKCMAGKGSQDIPQALVLVERTSWSNGVNITLRVKFSDLCSWRICTLAEEGSEYTHLCLKCKIRKCTGNPISAKFAERGRIAYRNKQIRHLPFIFFPCFAILSPTPLNVSDGTMNDHGREEDRIKPWEGRLESCDQTP